MPDRNKKKEDRKKTPTNERQDRRKNWDEDKSNQYDIDRSKNPSREQEYM